MFRNTVTTSAPGKLLLFGEHAVVYGRPCIVTAINQRLYVTAELLDEPVVRIDAPDINIHSETPLSDLSSQQFLECAVLNMKATHGVHITTKSDFLSTYGFGSSSASVVALLKALSHKINNNDLFSLAYKTILEVQGVGSGFDAAAAVYGGTLVYTKNTPPVELKASGMPLIVGYSGVKADTATIVKDVAIKKEKEPEKIGRIFDGIAEYVKQASETVSQGDWKRAGRIMDFNHEYLRDLGVSTHKLEDMISAAKKAGAWGAKLSGAGGGDCMIALVADDKRKAVTDAIAEAGGQIMDVEPNAEGVRIEK